MRLFSLCLAAFSFGFFLIVILVGVRRWDQVAKRLCFFSIAVGGWSFFSAMYSNEFRSMQLTELFIRLGHIFAPFIPITWLHFVITFIGRKEPFKYLYTICYIYSCFLVALLPFDFYIKPPTMLGISIFAFHSGPLYTLFTVYFFIVVVVGFVYLIRHYKKTSGQKRLQLKYFLLANGFGYFGGACLFCPVYGINWPSVFVIVMPLYPVFTGIALIKYGLFNEEDLVKTAHKDKLATIGTLATSINHEIKNPLYVIRGLAESFAQNEIDRIYKTKGEALNDARERLDKAKIHTDRAVEIMRNFSNFSKQRVDEEPLIVSLSVSDIIDHILPLIRYELELDKVKIVKLISVEGLAVKADERYLEEILFNLIMNSCQAMKQTGGELTLSAKEGNDKVLIEIKDNGPGITKEAQKQIFEPFYTTKEEGTGLGLYITKQLVEKIGGKISLESEPGQGTVFRVELKQAAS